MFNGLSWSLAYTALMEKKHTSSSLQPASYAHPVHWLRQLTQLQPAQWSWSRSIRAMIGLVLPLVIGSLTNQLGIAMWLAMGTLMQVAGERDNPYPVLFHRVLITAPLAALGLLLGYLSILPWEFITLIMAALAFLSAILSSYNSALSIGTMQMLLMATVALGNPHIDEYWHLALLSVLGAAFYLLLLAIEAKFSRHRPEDTAVVNILRSLSQLAQHRGQAQPTGQDEAAISNGLNTLYTLMLQTRSTSPSRNVNSEYLAALVQRFDSVFACLEGLSETADLLAAAHVLQQTATDYDQKTKQAPQLPVFQSKEAQSLAHELTALFDALWKNRYALFKNTMVVGTKKQVKSWSVLLGELNPGKEVLLSASALALCMCLAYGLRWLDDVSHWYWAPLTVVLVMKPDMGSIFSRSILRSLGTSFGAIIGGIVLYFAHPGALFIALVGVLGAILPWAAQRSYAVMSAVITPLIIILIDYISPEKAGINYALLRFEYTVLGGVIALLFGYLIWPKNNHAKFSKSFHGIRSGLASYLRAVLQGVGQAGFEGQVAKERRNVYGQLANVRMALQRQLSDPPPAGQEALSWYPLISSASRLANSITTYSIAHSASLSTDEQEQLQDLARWIESGQVDQANMTRWLALQGDSAEQRFLQVVASELQHVKGIVRYQS